MRREWTLAGAPRGLTCVSVHSEPTLRQQQLHAPSVRTRSPTLRRRRVARSYAALRKHEKIVAFLDNPKAAKSDSEGEEEEEQKPKTRVFKASQQAGGTPACTHARWRVGEGAPLAHGWAHRLRVLLGYRPASRLPLPLVLLLPLPLPLPLLLTLSW